MRAPGHPPTSSLAVRFRRRRGGYHPRLASVGRYCPEEFSSTNRSAVPASGGSDLRPYRHTVSRHPFSGCPPTPWIQNVVVVPSGPRRGVVPVLFTTPLPRHSVDAGLDVLKTAWPSVPVSRDRGGQCPLLRCLSQFRETYSTCSCYSKNINSGRPADCM